MDGQTWRSLSRWSSWRSQSISRATAALSALSLASVMAASLSSSFTLQSMELTLSHPSQHVSAVCTVHAYWQVASQRQTKQGDRWRKAPTALHSCAARPLC